VNETELLTAFYEDIKPKGYYRDAPITGDIDNITIVSMLPEEYKKFYIKCLREKFSMRDIEIHISSTYFQGWRRFFGAVQCVAYSEFWEKVSRWGEEGFEYLPEIPHDRD
jgi:hypothetical protein